MESPKRTTKRATGIHGSMGPVSPMPMTLPAQPHWNTATITP